MKSYLALSLFCIGLFSNLAFARADSTPPQLNISGFTHCLADQEHGFDFSINSDRYHFSFFDLFLPYLAIYPGTHLPSPIIPLQRQSENYWQTPWEAQGETLARSIAKIQPTTPAQALQLAMKTCDTKDVFCAALNLQNVYKTFGRHDQAVATDSSGVKTDYNPSWFKDHADEWNTLLPAVQNAMISLRTDNGGDRWGEWYHFFGILAYGARDLTLGKPEDSLSFIVRMNQLLNPLIAGEPENALKARFDRDSAVVVWDYLREDLPVRDPNLQCNQRAAFVEQN